MLQFAARAGPPGPAFFFLPCPSFSQRFLSEWGQRWFSLAWTSLVSFPYLSSIPHTALHRASFFFASKTRLPLPLKGEGRGITFLGLVGSALFVQNWVTLAQQGRLCSCWCRSPTRPPKPHTGPHRAEFGSHRLFLVRFFCGSPANWRSRW